MKMTLAFCFILLFSISCLESKKEVESTEAISKEPDCDDPKEGEELVKEEEVLDLSAPTDAGCSVE